MSNIAEILERILDKPAKMKALSLGNDMVLNLKELGGGRGVRNLTIRNTGQTNIIIDDEGREIIAPGELFLFLNGQRITNEKLKIRFEHSPGVMSNGVVRYLVDDTTCQ